ncbi:hypothetical protein LWI28_009344 [Acer negundo]|uniref:RNase H type-1 domain-containing protein n=1 Tax=Acer negundo TaxID=4023 RepID=A0AAD5JH31_ACENE|nr:hypothetical protein LWI28_009344 [Acer negundo]
MSDNMVFLDWLISCKSHGLVGDMELLFLVLWRVPAMNVQILPSLRPHDVGFYKVNIDAALDCVGKISGSRAIIRDSKGLVMAFCTHISSGLLSPLMAEALAILQGIHFAFQGGRIQASARGTLRIKDNLVEDGVQRNKEDEEKVARMRRMYVMLQKRSSPEYPCIPVLSIPTSIK